MKHSYNAEPVLLPTMYKEQQTEHTHVQWIADTENSPTRWHHCTASQKLNLIW